MRLLTRTTLFLWLMLYAVANYAALLDIKLTHWADDALPIAIVPFSGDPSVANELNSVISTNLANSGRFRLTDVRSMPQRPDSPLGIDYSAWRGKAVNYVVVGSIKPIRRQQYEVTVSLVNVMSQESENVSSQSRAILFVQEFTVNETSIRPLAHHISDQIYQALLGIPGIFSTQIAYIVVDGDTKNRSYTLEVSDADGYNPHPLLKSSHPIMSPAWSPDGKKIAYVTFENKKAQIYIQDVTTGKRQLITSFPGINGAPAWSPDGNKLAVVLSHSGSPKLYTVDLRNKKLEQLTHGNTIDTEPAYSPDGQSIIFTSNRGGSPQIYRLNLKDKSIARVTYQGNYNARAQFTPDGKGIVMLHRDRQAGFAIAYQDLQSGRVRLLTRSGLDESPSVAPNGNMVLFASNESKRMQLGMVSTDGRVILQLPARQGNVQEPAWAPFS